MHGTELGCLDNVMQGEPLTAMAKEVHRVKIGSFRKGMDKREVAKKMRVLRSMFLKVDLPEIWAP